MTTRSFISGLLVLAAVIMALSGAVWLVSHGTSRPEGVAENWLTDVSDTTRKGVEGDATHRAEKIGPLEFADHRLVSSDNKGKSAFDDIEVGKAVRVNNSPNEVRVEFRVHTLRNQTKDSVKVLGVITLRKMSTPAGWHVVALHVVNDAHTVGDPPTVVLAGLPALPSDGGPPPSSAPLSLWVAGLAGSVLVGLIGTALVKLSGRAPASSLAAAV